MIYFLNGKVSGVASDRSWSADGSSYDIALALYRLVDARTHSEPAPRDRVRIRTRSNEWQHKIYSLTVLRWAAHQAGHNGFGSRSGSKTTDYLVGVCRRLLRLVSVSQKQNPERVFHSGPLARQAM
jgi:hypothetical protein